MTLMRTGLARRLGIAAASALLGMGPAATATAQEARLADYFGFQPIEVYKLDNRINGLTVHDLDGDKAADLVVINNARSRIDLLLTGKDEGGEDPARKASANELEFSRRMRQVSVPVNKEVVSLQVGDFNHDGKPDLAYYGTPAELIVLYNQGEGRFGSETRRINSGEALESNGALAVGDLNRDGLDDLFLLAAGEVVAVYQLADGKLSEPERLPHTAASPRFLKAVDLDGDGGDDLLLMDGSTDDPIRVRFSTAEGRLGPEQRFAIEPLRAYAFGQVDGKKGEELLSIDQQSGRVRVMALEEAELDEPGKRGRLIFYPLPPGNARNRSLDVGDLDGDGKVDVVVTDPANAQFLVYRQAGTGSLGTAKSFPGLVGGRTVKLGDLDGDKKADVLVLSEQEKQIGRSAFEDSRLSFPTPLPISGEPVALDLADLDGDGSPEVVYISRTAGVSDSFALRALKREASGTLIPFRWGNEDGVPLKGVSGTPPALEVLDVNLDQQPDFLVFNAFGPPLLLLGREGEPPAAGGGLGPLAAVTPAGLTVTELDGPSLIVAQNTFARNVRLDRQGRWEVRDQYNTGRSAAQVVGAAALDVDGNGLKEVVLLDRNAKSLMFLAAREGVYRPDGTLSVGPLDFLGMHVADFDGDGRDDLLLAGTDRFGVVLTGRKGLRFKTLASYESNRKEATLGDLAFGDVNADGLPDLVITDVAEHFLEIVTATGQGKGLERGLSFKVFEKKSFRDVDSLIEPRELAIGDLDGDGRSDIALIVHDRMLVYRQDPGKEAVAAKPE